MDVAMATSFGTKMAITGFVFATATRRLVIEGEGLVVGRHNAAIANTLQLRDVALATIFGFQWDITSVV